MPIELDLDEIKTRAKLLASADRSLRDSLIALRREAGLTQKDVADFMDCTQQAVQKLERYDADPKLSTLRRYANAVGALVAHSVNKDEASSLWRGSGRVTQSSCELIWFKAPTNARATPSRSYRSESSSVNMLVAA